METIAIILCVVCAVTWGVVARDWHYRKLEIDAVVDARQALEKLEVEYKGYLSRLHDLDSSRAKQLAEQQGAIERLNMHFSLGSKR